MFPIKELANKIYYRFVRPMSSEDDLKRRELIFNVLLLGTIALVSCGLLLTLVSQIQQDDVYDGTPPITFIVAILILATLYVGNRRRFRSFYAYAFVILLQLLATHGLYQYGYAMPQGILVYMLVVIMASILISVRAASVMMSISIVTLISIAYMQISGLIKPNLDESNNSLDVVNLIVNIFLLGIVLLVSSLSNIEIERSLRLARKSENDLRKERNSLEVKVRERTRELERAQVEKTLELYRFAEFGRMSSTILHDIADPLTAVSLNLEQLEYREKSQLVKQVRQGINHLERYVYSARRQLRNQSEEKVFNSKTEIKRVHDLLLPKARNQRITLIMQLEKSAWLYGDSTRFNQILANLIANAIDAYTEESSKRLKIITIRTKFILNQLSITVEDKGVGIPESELNKIFEPFFTTKASKRGTGIGLTIIKRIIEEDFKGSIEVKSTSDKGTVFRVLLPLHQP